MRDQSRSFNAGRVPAPSRGDVAAAVSVALMLIPQSLAYAQLAGLPPVQGLYVAAVAPLLAALAGSSPYLQTGPAAMTSLLTLGALTPLAASGTAEIAAHAAVLAVLVGLFRLVLALLRGGVFAYLLSEPAMHGFTVAVALLIVASQILVIVDQPPTSANPFAAAADALAQPAQWQLPAVALGVGTVVVLVLARRAEPLFPGAPLVAAVGLMISALTSYPGSLVGTIPTSLPQVRVDLLWSAVPQLLLPAAVIAVIGFAETVAIARRYAAGERQRWDPNRELLGQGLANIAAGLAGGYPPGGSLSRSAQNKAAGATSRWSGALTGVLVLCALPATDLLAGLPRSVLAGLVIAPTLSLINFSVFTRSWRFSPLQGSVALATFVATLAFAPRIDRGVLVGVGLAIAVHLWRELRLDISAELTPDNVLHVRPEGVLYYASAPALQDRVIETLGRYPEARAVVVHLGGLGRIDLSGMLAIRELLTESLPIPIPVTVADIPAHSERLVARVLQNHRMEPPPRQDRAQDPRM